MAAEQFGGARGFLARYREICRRTEGLFGRISAEAFWSRPIALRHPICFYRGHLAAFDVNTLLRRALGAAGIRPDFERLFERGIDPADEAAAREAAVDRWPPREEIEAYVAQARRRIEAALGDLDGGRPSELAAMAAHTCLEHQEMHQETLLYIFHRLAYDEKIPPPGHRLETAGVVPARRRVSIPAGRATLGAAPGEIPFGWDNEFPRMVVEVPAFEIEADDVTNADFLEFVEAGGYRRPELWEPDDWSWRAEHAIAHPAFWARHDGAWRWRAMFEEADLPPAWPVYVSLAEARAYARWRGLRLPAEAELHRAAYAAPDGRERAYPWGSEEPDGSRGNFDFARYDPVPVGSSPAGTSAWGVRDLAGNGWEWTDTPWSGFPGFSPMPTYPQYSADFFDGRHFAMKGASPATAAGLLRRSFRNWFQAHYPYPYVTFRCARDAA
jgi:iron(II)-dependent oxidoreductase